jgi:hypothetical protein
MCLQEKEWEGAGWIDLAHETDIWQAVVNMVMNLQIS